MFSSSVVVFSWPPVRLRHGLEEGSDQLIFMSSRSEAYGTKLFEAL